MRSRQVFVVWIALGERSTPTAKGQTHRGVVRTKTEYRYYWYSVEPCFFFLARLPRAFRRTNTNYYIVIMDVLPFTHASSCVCTPNT